MANNKLTQGHADEIMDAVYSEELPTSSRELGIVMNPNNPINPKTLRDRIASLGLNSAVKSVFDKNKLTRSGREPRSLDDSVAKISSPASASDQYVQRERNKTGEVLESKGGRIRTLEDLLADAQVDMTKWRVEKHVVNKWETYSERHGVQELFQVKAWLAPNTEVMQATIWIDAATRALVDHAPEPLRSYRRKTRPGLVQDILIPDLHLGKLAHAEETGSNYDANIAVQAFRYVLDSFLEQAESQKVSRIIFPVGNDLLHVDSAEDNTTAGTKQDTDSRYHRSITKAVDLMLEAITKMMQLAPVDAVIIPGNHARMNEYMLGQILRVWSHSEPRLTLHDSPAPRKYLEHGRNLFGFTHGDGIRATDLPLIMAEEAAQMWARTEHRFWSLGHNHKRDSKQFVQAVQELKGVEVRTSPSLSGTDSWHMSKGYIGNLRAAESHIYDQEEGEIGRFRATIPDSIKYQ